MKGIQVELTVLLILQTLGTSLFERFEIETPVWKRLLKWTILIGATLGLYSIIEHWSLILPLSALVLGSSFHLTFCRRQQIHPLYATPRRKYYELRGWKWQD